MSSPGPLSNALILTKFLITKSATEHGSYFPRCSFGEMEATVMDQELESGWPWKGVWPGHLGGSTEIRVPACSGLVQLSLELHISDLDRLVTSLSCPRGGSSSSAGLASSQRAGELGACTWILGSPHLREVCFQSVLRPSVLSVAWGGRLWHQGIGLHSGPALYRALDPHCKPSQNWSRQSLGSFHSVFGEAAYGYGAHM